MGRHHLGREQILAVHGYREFPIQSLIIFMGTRLRRCWKHISQLRPYLFSVTMHRACVIQMHIATLMISDIDLDYKGSGGGKVKSARTLKMCGLGGQF